MDLELPAIGATYYNWRIMGEIEDEAEPKVEGELTGSSHCDWESAVFLHMSWPPGTVLRPIGDDYEQGSFRQ